MHHMQHVKSKLFVYFPVVTKLIFSLCANLFIFPLQDGNLSNIEIRALVFGGIENDRRQNMKAEQISSRWFSLKMQYLQSELIIRITVFYEISSYQ